MCSIYPYLKYVILLVFCSSIISCLSLYDITDSRSFVRQDLTKGYQLTKGIEKEQVVQIIGHPLKTEFNNFYETWHYCNTSLQSDEYLALYFVNNILAQKQFYNVKGVYGSCANNFKRGNYKEPDRILLTNQFQKTDVTYKLHKGIEKKEVLKIIGPPAKSEIIRGVEIWHYCNQDNTLFSGNYISLAFIDGKLMEKQTYSVDRSTNNCFDHIKKGTYREFDLSSFTQNVSYGMTKEQVISSMGSPVKSEFNGKIEEWHYCNNGLTGDYIALYFKEGILIEKLNYTVTIDDKKGLQENCSKFIKKGNYRLPDKVIQILN